MARACALRNIPFILTSRAELDLTAPETVAAALDRIAPWAVVNAAGWVRVDEAETARDACLTANARGAVALAKACGDRGVASLRSAEHTSALPSLMRISYAVFCLKQKT